MKKDNEADKTDVKAGAAFTSLLSDASLLNQKSSTTGTHSSTRNKEQFEQICFACNEIHPYNSTANNKGDMRVLNSKVQEIGWSMLRMQL